MTAAVVQNLAQLKVLFRKQQFSTAAIASASFPGGSEVKASACNAGDLGLIPVLGRSPGEGNGDPFQCSCLENPMDRGDWRATVHGVAKNLTRLSDFTFTLRDSIQQIEQFSGGLVVGVRVITASGLGSTMGSIPAHGTEIPQAVQCG